MKLQNKLGIAVIITVIVVIFSLQALAKKTEITGWDKAKFGMSSEELKKAYREEEEYFKTDIFWKEERENKFSHTPYILSTSRFIIFGKEGIVFFYFVNNKLFEIIITDCRSPKGEIEFIPGELVQEWEKESQKGIMTPEERKKKMMQAVEKIKSMEEKEQKRLKSKSKTSGIRDSISVLLASFSRLKYRRENIIRGMKENKPLELLISKYGEPSIVEWNGGGAISRWDDGKGNILLLKDCFPLSADVPTGLVYYSFIITYTDGELMKLWTAKIDEWKKERKRITEKGIEIF